MVAPKGNNVFCLLIVGFLVCVGFAIYFISSFVQNLNILYILSGICMIFLAIVCCKLSFLYANNLEKRTSKKRWTYSSSYYTIPKSRQEPIKKTPTTIAQLKRAPSMIGCHVCGATYKTPVKYCEKCGAQIIKSMS